MARCPDVLEGDLSAFITPLRWQGDFDLASVRNHIGKMILLSVGRMNVRFKGELTALPNDQFLLICSPQIDEVEKMKKLGLTFQDFSRFDTTIDNVFLLQAARQSQMETQRAAQKLKESEARYRVLIEQDLLIMVTFDGAGKIVFGNSAWKMFAGGDSHGRDVTDFIKPSCSGQWNSALSDLNASIPTEPRALSATTKIEMAEGEDFTLISSTGDELTAEGFVGYHQVSEGGTTDLYFAMFSDVTERQRAARILEETREKMLQSQKMSALGRLAGGIAHDFNNLLGVIMSASCILLEDLDEDSPLREDAEMILNSCESGAKLSSQLMTFSHNKRTTPEHLNPANVSFRMSQVLDTVVGEHVRLRFQHDATDAHILIDRLELEQILITTCANAREAMPSGGTITLTVSRPSEGQCRLTIADEGIGMSPEIVEQACDPFFSTKSEGNHPGLGLAVVYGIVTRNSGDLSIESVPGKGTQIHVTFPESVEGTVQPRPETSSSRPQFEGPFTDMEAPHVLLVEDREELRIANARSLRRMGCHVTAVEGVQSAFDVLRGAPEAPDVLVTDVQLGDGNGAELAEQCVEEGLLSRVLLVTGYARKEHLDAIAKRHGWKILMKPFTPGQLSDELARTLRSN